MSVNKIDEFGRKLKQLMKIRRVSVKDLAEAIKFPDTNLSSIRTGKLYPNPRTLGRILTHFKLEESVFRLPYQQFVRAISGQHNKESKGAADSNDSAVEVPVVAVVEELQLQNMGANIYALRTASDSTQEDLAQLLEVDILFFKKVEAGVSRLGMKKLRILEELFEIGPTFFLLHPVEFNKVLAKVNTIKEKGNEESMFEKALRLVRESCDSNTHVSIAEDSDGLTTVFFRFKAKPSL